jgi:hypothetical protein
VDGPAGDPPCPRLAGLLRSHLSERGDEPFLVARGDRGHFRWVSFRRATDLCEGAAPARLEETEAIALLRAVELSDFSTLEIEALERRVGTQGRERDVWISHRQPLHAGDARLAAWAAETGAVIVREPSPRLHPALFAWARPTIVAGAPAELEALLDGFAAEAPRLGAGRWRRRRLARLRAVLVAADGEGAARSLEARLAALGAGSARVLPFPGTGW